MSIDYNALAEKYDLTRTANMDILNRFAEELSLDGISILDFGCGTGNFAYALCKLTSANIYGVEPSDGMREKAIAKGLDVKEGNHTHLPFEDCFFDFIYMTDVIHHVPDLNTMFTEFMRVLKPNGHVCILTESHEQLVTRFWTKHFPSTITVERERYPDIPVIMEAAKSAGLLPHKTISTDKEQAVTISEDFIRLVENKGYSMFQMISDKDYKAGLAALKKDYCNGERFISTHGETLLWLKKVERNDFSDITFSNNLTVEQYNALRLAVEWIPIEHSQAKKGLEHTAFLVVANIGDEPIGMARVITDYGSQVLIADVIVRPEYQGRGVGKEMMRKVMEYIRDSTSPGQRKTVTLNAAKGKEGFYKPFGFFERPTDKFGPGMTQWISKEGVSI